MSHPAVMFIVKLTRYVGFPNTQSYGDVNMTLLLLCKWKIELIFQ